MIKNGFKIILVLVVLITFSGCGQKYPELKSDAIAFDISTAVYGDDEESYGVITYNDRMYFPYGTLDGSIKNEDIKDCIGYIIQNEHVTSVVDLENKDTRVYTLVGDDDENYLMVYYIGTTLMNQPDFYRAIDTKGVEINTPKYISSQDYLIWK